MQRFETILLNLHWLSIYHYSNAQSNEKTREDLFWEVATLVDGLALRFLNISLAVKTSTSTSKEFLPNVMAIIALALGNIVV